MSYLDTLEDEYDEEDFDEYDEDEYEDDFSYSDDDDAIDNE